MSAEECKRGGHVNASIFGTTDTIERCL